MKVTSLEKKLFLFLFLAYAFFFVALPGWNINSRMDLVYAIVDQHKLTIDEYIDTPQYGTGDLALYGNHYYCDKSPILSFMGVPVYWLWQEITDLTVGYVSSVKGRYPVVVFTLSLLSAGLAVLIYRFLGFIRKNPRDQLWLTLFYSLGTLAFPYSILFFSHQMSAVFLFVSFYILYSLTVESPDSTFLTVKKGLLVGGFFASLAMTTENPAGIGFLGLMGYAWVGLKNKKDFAWFILGAVIPPLLVMPYNYACFGSPFHSGYQFEAFTYFNKEMARGFMGITYPKWKAVWGITFSPYRGLFFYSPILLFAIPGFWYMFTASCHCEERRDEAISFLYEARLFLFIVLSFFVFNFSYYAWNGGWGVGPRLIVPMLPFFIIPIYYLMPKWNKIIFPVGLFCILIFSAFCLTDPQVRDNCYFPLKEFTLPNLLHGQFTESVFSLLGLSKPLSVSIWILYMIAGLFYLNRQTFPQSTEFH